LSAGGCCGTDISREISIVGIPLASSTSSLLSSNVGLSIDLSENRSSRRHDGSLRGQNKSDEVAIGQSQSGGIWEIVDDLALLAGELSIQSTGIDDGVGSVNVEQDSSGS